MAMRVNDGVEPIKSPPGTDRDGSRPKPPKAVAHRDSLEATRSVPDHKKAKRRLTVKTVAFSADNGRLRWQADSGVMARLMASGTALLSPVFRRSLMCLGMPPWCPKRRNLGRTRPHGW